MAVRFSPDKATHELVVAKLASSGLTPEDGAKLKVRGCLPTETQGFYEHFEPLQSMYIPYFDPVNETISDRPKSAPYYRLRYLGERQGFAQLTERNKTKYVQPPNTIPAVYYPPLYEEWAELCCDRHQPLIITEGELKAAKACKEGFPTIGLGGVHAWRALKSGVTWLESLTWIEWVQRNVYVCFDSDFRTNKHVQDALVELIEALQEQGAITHVVLLPEIDGQKKVGLDDYFVLTGERAEASFKQLLHNAEPFGLAKPLFTLNKHYVYCPNPGLIIDMRKGTKHAPSAFRDHIESTKKYEKATFLKDGSVHREKVSAAKEWLNWPQRHQVDEFTYAPGQEREYIDEHNHSIYNTWPGWGCTPKKGDVKPFLQLIDHLFTEAEKEAKEWFIRWCAYPLQYPGVKMFSSAVVHGVRHGTGKTLVGYTLSRIYGKNYTAISQGDLHASFNDWAEGKQFVMGDDVTGSDKRQDNDMLKKLITQNELRVNAKYVPTYVVPDCINYYFTSNHPNAFFLEDDDRRFFVHEVTVGPLSEEFYMDYSLWVDSNQGPPAVFDYLLHLDLGDFNPSAPAFKTIAKTRMIQNNKSDLAAWVETLLENPDAILRSGDVIYQRDLWTSKELLHFYDPEGKTRCTPKAIGNALAQAMCRPLCENKPLRLSNGIQGRYYAIRNFEKWRHAKNDRLIKHIEAPMLPPPKPPKY